MKKNVIVVTGGAGFIGSNLIKKLVSKTKYNIISIDNYSSGTVKNHLKNNRVKYIRSDTYKIDKILDTKKKNIKSLFHFAEFSRIYQSFDNNTRALNYNIISSAKVIDFCKINKIKIIYSATSAAFGNKFKDCNLSPYSFYKTNNLNMIINYNKWFNLRFKILYFFNVYGPSQIGNGLMAAVIGIFEDLFKKKKSLPVVRPGTQRRNFTHIDDVTDVCIKALSDKKNGHWAIIAKKNYSIIEIAKFFKSKFHYLPSRKGERFQSTMIKNINGKKINYFIGSKDLKKYIKKKYNFK